MRYIYVLFFMVCIGCAGDDPHLKGPILFNPSMLPGLSSEESACVVSSLKEHVDLTILAASGNYDSSSVFSDFMYQIEGIDKALFNNISTRGGIDFTLFLPTNSAWARFLAANPAYKELSGSQINTLVRGHLMDEAFTYEAILRGMPHAPDMNGAIVVFEQDVSACLLINDQATPQIVDDQCKNGVIHVINRVLVPENGLLGN
ncbi:MAG: fasciclin domain-containing protein [Bacteroidota bacterium]